MIKSVRERNLGTTEKPDLRYDVRARTGGGKAISRTFKVLKEGLEWKAMTEGTLIGKKLLAERYPELVAAEAARKEAEAAKQEAEAARQAITVASLIDSHLALNPNMASTAELMWWRDEIGHIPFYDLKPTKITELLNRRLNVDTFVKMGPKNIAKLAKKGLKPVETRYAKNTVRKYGVTLQGCFTQHLEAGTITSSPFERHAVKIPDQAVIEKRVFTRDTFGLVLAECDKQGRPQLKEFITVSALTGARASELLRLTWEYVDLEAGIIKLVDTKNGSTRTVALPVQVLEILRARDVALQARKLPTYERDAQPVFVGFDGHKAKGYKKPYGQVLVGAGLIPPPVKGLRVAEEGGPKHAVPRKYNLHTLRHTNITNYVSAGAPSALSMEHSGHRSMRVHRRYVHADMATMRAAAQAACDLMFPAQAAERAEKAKKANEERP